MANLISSLRGEVLQLVERHEHPPRATRRRLVGYLWEAPLTAQRASTEAPFPQPNLSETRVGNTRLLGGFIAHKAGPAKTKLRTAHALTGEAAIVQ